MHLLSSRTSSLIAALLVGRTPHSSTTTPSSCIAAPHTSIHFNLASFTLCKHSSDCPIPTVCCRTPLVDYCCDPGGGHSRLRRRIRLPNVTFPLPDNIPSPRPAVLPHTKIRTLHLSSGS